MLQRPVGGHAHFMTRLEPIYLTLVTVEVAVQYETAHLMDCD